MGVLPAADAEIWMNPNPVAPQTILVKVGVAPRYSEIQCGGPMVHLPSLAVTVTEARARPRLPEE